MAMADQMVGPVLFLELPQPLVEQPSEQTAVFFTIGARPMKESARREALCKRVQSFVEITGEFRTSLPPLISVVRRGRGAGPVNQEDNIRIRLRGSCTARRGRAD
jgi:hypothetical protein